ncbi:RNA polymerase Rpc34 subunit-domain-containing protein [Ganoderma leucocontextum]|nr:RNA polymerase Rpc34 subunit-domain-containing protein [Ganoderma leucocontextum]
MSGRRKLNPLEQKLHQAALADPKKSITQKECDALIPDPPARLPAINFLLGTGLWKALKDTSGNLSYRVVTKKELEVKKDMSGEEGMILSYIQSAGNEGIWTKHLKAKTELHQTVIDRCLKSLVQKQLIKAVKSVKYPTRKIYMLYHLDPSVEMTGGPWYTDNELDTEFIKLLCSACLRFIRDRSTPKQKSGESSSSSDQSLYPISAAPAYPTAQQVLTFLSKSRITETQLGAEHVEMLLNVLVLDGEVERVPAFGAAMWEVSQTQADGADNASDSECEAGRGAKEKGKGKEKTKRKRKEREDSDSLKRERKRSKRSRSSSGSESDSQSDSEDSEDERERRRKKDKKRKSRSRAASSDEDDDDRDSRKRKKKRSRDNSGDEDGDGDMSDADRKSKNKSKKRKKSRRYSSESDSGSDDDRRSHSRSKSKSRSGRKRSSSPAGEEDVTASLLGQDCGAYVYRAVRQERVAGGGGGLAQTPCVRCSVFDFCKDIGPVNAQDCEYYGSWLLAADVATG